jgi:membrane protein
MTQNDIYARAERWALARPSRVADVSPALLLVRVARRFADVRVMGLSAEMTYYALLSVFPMIAALGASLGFLERFIGADAVEEVQATVLFSLQLVFTDEVINDVVAPMVQGLLQQERTGFAVGGFAVSLFLASRVFRSAIDTLDSAYEVEERRGTVALWTLGFFFALGAILTSATVLVMIVVGPLFGLGGAVASWFGMGRAFEIGWVVLRWPFVFLVATAFLSVLYRAGPNVRNSWRQSLPGAVFGMVSLVLVALGFHLYLDMVGSEQLDIRDADEAVAVGAQVVGAVMAALLWLWLSGMALLTGGVVNAELSRLRDEMPPPQV